MHVALWVSGSVHQYVNLDFFTLVSQYYCFCSLPTSLTLFLSMTRGLVSVEVLLSVFKTVYSVVEFLISQMVLIRFQLNSVGRWL